VIILALLVGRLLHQPAQALLRVVLRLVLAALLVQALLLVAQLGQAPAQPLPGRLVFPFKCFE
jgi:hypothetical protein